MTTWLSSLNNNEESHSGPLSAISMMRLSLRVTRGTVAAKLDCCWALVSANLRLTVMVEALPLLEPPPELLAALLLELALVFGSPLAEPLPVVTAVAHGFSILSLRSVTSSLLMFSTAGESQTMPPGCSGSSTLASLDDDDPLRRTIGEELLELTSAGDLLPLEPPTVFNTTTPPTTSTSAATPMIT